MNLRRIETEKAATEMNCKYAQLNDLNGYKPPPVYVKESRIIVENIDLMIKSKTLFKNRLQAVAYKASKHLLVLVNQA